MGLAHDILQVPKYITRKPRLTREGQYLLILSEHYIKASQPCSCRYKPASGPIIASFQGHSPTSSFDCLQYCSRFSVCTHHHRCSHWRCRSMSGLHARGHRRGRLLHGSCLQLTGWLIVLHSVSVGNQALTLPHKYKYLGFWVNEHWDMAESVNHIVTNATRSLNRLISKSRLLSDKYQDVFYQMVNSLPLELST